jgi:hypothetical protein
MENTNPSKKRQARRLDRVTLRDEVLARLAIWREQLIQNFPGLKISNADLVEYCILAKSDELLASDLKAIKNEYYDEIQLTAWALKEMKEAKKRGEEVSLADILNRGKSPTEKRARPKKSEVIAEPGADPAVGSPAPQT